MTTAIKHRTVGLARRCNAWDILHVVGGTQCGNCLEHNVPPPPGARCSATTSDNKPCPLAAEDGIDLCWAHKVIAANHPRTESES